MTQSHNNLQNAPSVLPVGTRIKWTDDHQGYTLDQQSSYFDYEQGCWWITFAGGGKMCAMEQLWEEGRIELPAPAEQLKARLRTVRRALDEVNKAQTAALLERFKSTSFCEAPRPAPVPAACAWCSKPSALAHCSPRCSICHEMLKERLAAGGTYDCPDERAAIERRYSAEQEEADRVEKLAHDRIIAQRWDMLPEHKERESAAPRADTPSWPEHWSKAGYES